MAVHTLRKAAQGIGGGEGIKLYFIIKEVKMQQQLLTFRHCPGDTEGSKSDFLYGCVFASALIKLKILLLKTTLDQI